MGVNWDLVLSESLKNAISLADIAATFPLPPTVTSFGKMRLMSSNLGNQSTYDVTIKLLKTVGDTKLLSSPRITAINNQEAKILVGTREAYVTNTVTQGQTTTTTAENVTFLDVGVQLTVVPIINEDGYVTMKIKPEVSSVARYLITPEQNQIPIVDTATAETRVMVKDGKPNIVLVKRERFFFAATQEGTPKNKTKKRFPKSLAEFQRPARQPCLRHIHGRWKEG